MARTHNQIRGAIIASAMTLIVAGCSPTTRDAIVQAGAAAGAWIEEKALAADAWIGQQLLALLGEEDRGNLAKTTQTAARTGEDSTWTNSETGVSGRSKVVDTQSQKKQVKVKILKEKVKEIPPLDLIGETYRATSTVNVRGGPSTDYVIIDQIPISEAIVVVGKVTDKPWLMVSEGGIGTGFVSEKFLQAAPDLDVAEVSANQAVPEGEVEEETVAAEQVCRTVQQTVVLDDGSEHQQEVKACQGPNGWEIVG